MTGACGYAAVQSFAVRAADHRASGQTSMALGMPMLIPHSALLVGFGGTAIIAAVLAIARYPARWRSSDVAVPRHDLDARRAAADAAAIGTPIFVLLLTGAVLDLHSLS